MKIMDHERGDAHWRRVAKEAGIRPGTYRMRRHRGMSPREAATAPLTSERVGSNINPESASSIAEEYGINRYTISQHSKRPENAGLTNREIAEKIVGNKQKKKEQQLFNQRCRAHGKYPRTVRKHMEMYGFTEEQALAYQPKSKAQSGKEGRTAADAAKKIRIQAGDNSRDESHKETSGSGSLAQTHG